MLRECFRRKALDATEQQLDRVQRQVDDAHGSGHEFIEAHRLILRSPELAGEARRLISAESCAAEWAVWRAIELIRLTTTGNRNACSRLYSAACRAAAAMGYVRAITYTLEDEPGTSLRASGFTMDGKTKGGEWTPMVGLLRSAEKPTLFDPPKMPTGPKTRWVRAL
jgi:hypothetical protein